ncbi:MAG: hypothetical protein A3E51_26015 [Burkholderiales bacterium RIFCSPHIGHO2_12_FULL_67_38]|nr:MAG: hypothetical protein A3I64_11955 [Burkholderiales bacterium RIFCSPLOWO2_02_FULL_67_64]OGB45817.1 MAG: hypothetical protein A3E51_26015 [Burkholderiales bacterium RIFCSPHIGHO2_12_FULL_67_38]OGB94801.1 MAG: hypothetical protein A3G82_15515 [Burkholderiales bacterium RIFCSPLOWO2_12_FULL_67_210]
MDNNTLLAKTDKGREALAARSPELGPKLRTVLIMVDGKKSVAELGKFGGALAVLEQLEAGGWVLEVDASGQPVERASAEAVTEPAAAATADEVAPAVASAPVAPAPAPQTLPYSEARRMVVRYINDQLGPMGELTAIRVEGCKSPADLQALLPRIRDALSNYRNAAAVQRFDQELVPLLPKH